MSLFDSFRKKPNLEEQLQALRGLGISPNENFSTEQAISTLGRAAFEKSPYLFLLCVIGSEAEEPPYLPFSNDVWHLDSECIDGHGSYVRIARRMMLLTGGALPLENIEDYVDLEEGRASLSFTLRGQQVVWSAEVNDDWIDPAILSKFAQLLDRQKTGKRFTYVDTGGQDCVIGCSAPEQLVALKKATGLNVVWLT